MRNCCIFRVPARDEAGDTWFFPSAHPMATPHFNMSAIISTSLYAQFDARITSPGYESRHKEKLITIMEISGTGVPEERIAALEKRVRDMDALVRGLLDELLDFKAVAMKMSRQAGERSREELKQGPVVQNTASQAPAGLSSPASDAAPPGNSTVIRPKSARQPDVPAEPVMARIIQSDGTMKMEPRRGNENPLDSSSGYGRTRKRHL